MSDLTEDELTIEALESELMEAIKIIFLNLPSKQEWVKLNYPKLYEDLQKSLDKYVE